MDGWQILLCVMAFLRVGNLMRFLSPSVLSGFVSGSGAYIAIAMLKLVTGVKVRENAKRKKGGGGRGIMRAS